MIEIQIQKGDITQVQADAIVNPSNSFGWMGGGAAGAIKQQGGDLIEVRAVDKAPLEVGKAILTTAGKLPFKGIIHAPTMESPAQIAEPYNVKMSVRGALHLADDKGFKTIAMPGMGTGIGSFPVEQAAKVMIEEIQKFKPINLEKVTLIDLNEELVEAWQKVLK